MDAIKSIASFDVRPEVSSLPLDPLSVSGSSFADLLGQEQSRLSVESGGPESTSARIQAEQTRTREPETPEEQAGSAHAQPKNEAPEDPGALAEDAQADAQAEERGPGQERDTATRTSQNRSEDSPSRSQPEAAVDAVPVRRKLASGTEADPGNAQKKPETALPSLVEMALLQPATTESKTQKPVGRSEETGKATERTDRRSQTSSEEAPKVQEKLVPRLSQNEIQSLKQLDTRKQEKEEKPTVKVHARSAEGEKPEVRAATLELLLASRLAEDVRSGRDGQHKERQLEDPKNELRLRDRLTLRLEEKGQTGSGNSNGSDAKENLLWQQIQMRQPETVKAEALRTLDPRDFQNVLEKARFEMDQTGRSSASIRLRPESLGLMTLNLEARGDSVKGSVVVESQAALKAVERELESLRQELKLQGIQVESFSVKVRESFSSSQEFQQAQNQSGAGNFAGGQADREARQAEQGGNFALNDYHFEENSEAMVTANRQEGLINLSA